VTAQDGLLPLATSAECARCANLAGAGFSRNATACLFLSWGGQLSRMLEPASSGEHMVLELKVVVGRRHGEILRFPAGEYVFGSGPECHVRPNSPWVSWQHCLLRVTPWDVQLLDLASTNGTLVNGVAIREEWPLEVGDSLQIGPLVLQVIRTASNQILRQAA
jgi:hypothetical protein